MSRRSNLFGVGIVSASLPAWADYTALPNGQFIEFTTNTPADAGMKFETLANWCGGSFIPDFGVRGGVAYVGGGLHNPWVDSVVGGIGQQGVYVLDCDARQYVRRCYPQANHTGVGLVSDTDIDGSPTDAWGAYADDGSPQAKHTYNCINYMPAAWGGGSSGSMVALSKSGGVRQEFDPPPVTGQSATWRYDLSKPSHTVGDPSIFRLTGASTYDFGSGTPAEINDAPFGCIDLTREGWWSTHRANYNGIFGGRMVFTSKTGAISPPQGLGFGTGGVGGSWFWAKLHHFADDDIIVRLTDDYPTAGAPLWQVFVWQAGTSANWQPATLTRQTITDTNPSWSAPNNLAYREIGTQNPVWSTILGAFVWLDPGYPLGSQPTTTIRVWKLTPPPAGQRVSGTWTATWELVSAKPGTEATNRMNLINGNGDAGTWNDTYGRFVECPSLRAFVWTRDIDKYGQLIRLQGM
jgi:hypothetical protein